MRPKEANSLLPRLGSHSVGRLFLAGDVRGSLPAYFVGRNVWCGVVTGEWLMGEVELDVDLAVCRQLIGGLVKWGKVEVDRWKIVGIITGTQERRVIKTSGRRAGESGRAVDEQESQDERHCGGCNNPMEEVYKPRGGCHNPMDEVNEVYKPRGGCTNPMDNNRTHYCSAFTSTSTRFSSSTTSSSSASSSSASPSAHIHTDDHRKTRRTYNKTTQGIQATTFVHPGGVTGILISYYLRTSTHGTSG
ncbi:hypothetical protein LR48_Vigan10g175200 [Vigna angularis]|uniref:Uncharacterized protein n=1 Tax=Phaseolus angularis TaxID=3914 RepID=A0A0L9VLD7_PHAAN|nr:hypothetical protein LR48_Vigan10g175200 [Vigna angularis]